jgi:hypothetical protein
MADSMSRKVEVLVSARSEGDGYYFFAYMSFLSTRIYLGTYLWAAARILA